MEKRIITTKYETQKISEILELVTDCNVNLRWLHMKFRNGDFQHTLDYHDIEKVNSLITATGEFLNFVNQFQKNRGSK